MRQMSSGIDALQAAITVGDTGRLRAAGKQISGGLSQLAHGKLQAHRDLSLAALLQKGPGQRRVRVVGKEHLSGQAGPDCPAGLLDTGYLFLSRQILQQGDSSCLEQKILAESFHAILHYNIPRPVRQACFYQIQLVFRIGNWSFVLSRGKNPFLSLPR